MVEVLGRSRLDFDEQHIVGSPYAQVDKLVELGKQALLSKKPSYVFQGFLMPNCTVCYYIETNDDGTWF